MKPDCNLNELVAWMFASTNPSTPRPVVLYRFFESDGQPLYIGITHRLRDRFSTHRRSNWWDAVGMVSIEWFDHRYKAEEAERAAIKAERPSYNIRSAVGM